MGAIGGRAELGVETYDAISSSARGVGGTFGRAWRIGRNFKSLNRVCGEDKEEQGQVQSLQHRRYGDSTANIRNVETQRRSRWSLQRVGTLFWQP